MEQFLIMAAAAYLLGSIPFGLAVARRQYGIDPRREGSGNFGAANVYRLLGARAGLYTLLGDGLKGALPVGAALLWLKTPDPWREAAVAGVGAAAVLGHVFPLYLKFKGGKAVATAFGVVAVISPFTALSLFGAYAIGVGATRIASVGSLVAAWLLPLAMGFFNPAKAYLLLAGGLSALILFCHRENLERLFKGEEPRLYWGASAGRHCLPGSSPIPAREDAMLVRDWMTRDLISIQDDTSMMKALYIMNQNRFRRLPIMHGDKLVGIVTDRDLKEASPSKATTLDVHELYYLLAELQVKEIMTRNPVTVAADDTVERAAQVMLDHTISGLPVLDGQGKLAGILTQSDIFRAFMHITGIQQGGVQFALRLEDRPGLIKEVVDLLRGRGARFVSLLSSYTATKEGFRDVYIRVKNLPPDQVEAARAELAKHYEILYVNQPEEPSK